MYTETGKNHINQVLAGTAASLASHIYYGIDSFGTDGDAEPLLTDRHYTPFVAVRLPIISRTVVGNNIIFATSHDTSKVDEFLGNNMALVYENASSGKTIRIRKNVFNDFSASGWQNGIEQTELNSPKAWFNREGGIIVGANTLVYIEGVFSLAGYKKNDIFSIPMFWHGGSMEGGVVSVTFYFKGSDYLGDYTLTQTLTSGDEGLHYKFENGVPSRNEYGVYSSLDLSTPEPLVFQCRFSEVEGSTAFLNNFATIRRVEVFWEVPDPDCKLYMGSPQITPDYDADDTSVVVSWSPLNVTVVNAGTDSLSAEYRVIGA